VTRLAGRVVRGLPASAEAQRAHELLHIDQPEGPYIVDVGFGNLTPTAPLALRPDKCRRPRTSRSG
jgi:N-hydroxyarylamine O-acetyltransferase